MQVPERVTVTVTVEDTVKFPGGGSPIRVRMDNTTVTLIELGPRGAERTSISLKRAPWKSLLARLAELDDLMEEQLRITAEASRP